MRSLEADCVLLAAVLQQGSIPHPQDVLGDEVNVPEGIFEGKPWNGLLLLRAVVLLHLDGHWPAADLGVPAMHKRRKAVR